MPGIRSPHVDPNGLEQPPQSIAPGERHCGEREPNREVLLNSMPSSRTPRPGQRRRQCDRPTRCCQPRSETSLGTGPRLGLAWRTTWRTAKLRPEEAPCSPAPARRVAAAVTGIQTAQWPGLSGPADAERRTSKVDVADLLQSKVEVGSVEVAQEGAEALLDPDAPNPFPPDTPGAARRAGHHPRRCHPRQVEFDPATAPPAPHRVSRSSHRRRAVRRIAGQGRELRRSGVSAHAAMLPRAARAGSSPSRRAIFHHAW